MGKINDFAHIYYTLTEFTIYTCIYRCPNFKSAVTTLFVDIFLANPGCCFLTYRALFLQVLDFFLQI